MDAANHMDRVLAYVGQLSDIDVDALRDALMIRHLHREIELGFEHYIEAMNLTAHRFNILEALFHHPGHAMTPAELADAVHLTRAAMTGNLDALERDGYVRRTPHPSDRRKIRVELTPQGEALEARILPDHYRKSTRIAETMTPDERQLQLSFYRRVLAALKAVLEEEGRPRERGGAEGARERI